MRIKNDHNLQNRGLSYRQSCIIQLLSLVVAGSELGSELAMYIYCTFYYYHCLHFGRDAISIMNHYYYTFQSAFVCVYVS